MTNRSIQQIDPGDSVPCLSETLQALTEFMTGLAVSEKKDWALSIGYLMQRIRGGQFLHQLFEELKKYRNKGRIKPDYLRSEQSFSCLQEVLDFIDKDSPDDRRFQAMKAVFLTIATEELSDREDILPLQLTKICRTLSSAELLILSAAYDIFLNEKWKIERDHRKAYSGHGNTRDWEDAVLKITGLKFRELIRINEESLISKRLLSSNVYSDGSGFYYTEYYRLTPLGYHLCLFIKEYEKDEKSET